MKLSELSSSKGTYVGLRVLQPAGQRLYEFCRDNGIEVNKSTFERRLHVTVIYSRKQCIGLEPRDSVKYVATFSGYDIFDGSAGTDKALVMKLNAPGVLARHLEIMAKYGATYDFPVYIPHITLTYNYTGGDVLLPPFNDNIILGDEYVEDLDLNWSDM
jgi:hypothetical protein